MAGPDKRIYNIHRILLAECSPPLDALVNGKMKEAQNGIAWLQNVEVGTFLQFWEYLYTEDYTSIECIPGKSNPDKREYHDENCSPCISTNRQSSMRLDTAPMPPVDVAASMYYDPFRDAFHGSPTHNRYGSTVPHVPTRSNFGINLSGPHVPPLPRFDLSSTENQARKNFAARKYDPPSKKKPLMSSQTEAAFVGRGEWLLQHAKLYVFADMYDIDGLKHLSVHKLDELLSALQLRDEHVEVVLGLLEYVYANTYQRIGEPNDMRDLVANYVAHNLRLFVPNTDFQLLTKNNHSLVKDIFRLIIAPNVSSAKRSSSVTAGGV